LPVLRMLPYVLRRAGEEVGLNVAVELIVPDVPLILAHLPGGVLRYPVLIGHLTDDDRRRDSGDRDAGDKNRCSSATQISQVSNGLLDPLVGRERRRDGDGCGYRCGESTLRPEVDGKHDERPVPEVDRVGPVADPH
jgi:hypothetical protein